MTLPRKRRIALWTILLVGLEFQIPLGYMPAPLSSGSWVQFCPQGMTDEQVVALLGGTPESGAHAHHQGNDAGGARADSDATQCPFGGALFASLLDISLIPANDFFFAAPVSAAKDHFLTSRRFLTYSPRSPPVT